VVDDQLGFSKDRWVDSQQRGSPALVLWDVCRPCRAAHHQQHTKPCAPPPAVRSSAGLYMHTQLHVMPFVRALAPGATTTLPNNSHTLPPSRPPPTGPSAGSQRCRA
jgi:hypothetical protein